MLQSLRTIGIAEVVKKAGTNVPRDIFTKPSVMASFREKNSTTFAQWLALPAASPGQNVRVF